MKLITKIFNKQEIEDQTMSKWVKDQKGVGDVKIIPLEWGEKSLSSQEVQKVLVLIQIKGDKE